MENQLKKTGDPSRFTSITSSIYESKICRYKCQQKYSYISRFRSNTEELKSTKLIEKNVLIDLS